MAKIQTPIAIGGPRRIIGMVHLAPLPGTPFNTEGSVDATQAAAVRDAVALDTGGADGCLIQTVDRVYRPAVDCDPARVAAMTAIVAAVVKATRPDFLVGVQIMKNSIEAIAVAEIAGGRFVRATAFIGATASQSGMHRGDRYRVIAYRPAIRAENVGIIADIRTQHFSWTEGAPSLGRIACWARDASTDAVCLGDPDETTVMTLVDEVRAATPDLPIILSGHTNHANAARVLSDADGAFLGTCLDTGGRSGPMEVARVRSYMRAVREATR